MTHLSAIRCLHIDKGEGNPRMRNMVHLEQVLRGARSLQAKNRPVAQPRLPITPELLLKMRQSWEKQGNMGCDLCQISQTQCADTTCTMQAQSANMRAQHAFTTCIHNMHAQREGAT